MCIWKARNLMYWKFTSDVRLLKRAASLTPLLTVVGITYAGAFWFMLRSAMNEPDVSWARQQHNFMSWQTVRPDYQYLFFDPNGLMKGKPEALGPAFELQDEWKHRRHTGHPSEHEATV